MEFIHLEVWQDFEANQLNPAAAEWIAPTPETQGGEPWVFVIDADGIIVQRFDNVASEAELLAAVEGSLGEADS
jgi:peroxiredoxin